MLCLVTLIWRGFEKSLNKLPIYDTVINSQNMKLCHNLDSKFWKYKTKKKLRMFEDNKGREIEECYEDKDEWERMSHFNRVDIIFKEIQNPPRKSDSLESKILTDFIAESAGFSLLIFELIYKQRWSSYCTKLQFISYLSHYLLNYYYFIHVSC